GFARRALAIDDLMPPQAAARIHADRLAGALEHDHPPHALAAPGERLVARRLELDRVAAAPAAVGSDRGLGLRVGAAILQRRGRTSDSWEPAWRPAPRWRAWARWAPGRRDRRRTRHGRRARACAAFPGPPAWRARAPRSRAAG